MKTRCTLFHLFPVIFLLFLNACSLPMRPTPGSPQSPTVFPYKPSILSPTPTLLSTEIVTPRLPPTLDPTATRLLPTPTRTDIPQQPSQASTPIISKPSNNIYSVVLIAENEALYVREQPFSNANVIQPLAYDAQGIQRTGKTAGSSNPGWIEIKLATGKTGWVNEQYLTEAVPAASFSNDSRVPALLNQLVNTLEQKDGKGLAGLISPLHGFRLQYMRGGTVAVYDAEKSTWLLESTYAMSWGLHPGSGMPVKGTFSQEVLPALLDVLISPNMQIRYEDIQSGGTTYTAIWPKEYANINFLSAYRPGPAGHELNWRTWLIGVEYVDSKPYLFSLNMLVWEP